MSTGIELRPRKATSYRCSDPSALTEYLMHQGYLSMAPSNEHELARMKAGASIIIVWKSGAVVTAGADIERGRRTLRPLEPRQ